MKQLYLLIPFLFVLCFSSIAQPGTLDQAFGGDGLANINPVGVGFAQGQCMALTPDQKVLVGGYYYPDSSTLAWVVVRFTTSGDLDPTFGSGGIVTLPLGLGGDGVTGITVKPDGSMVLAGSFFIGSSIVGAVCGLTPSGDYDPTFHGGGFELVENYRPRGVVLTGTGKLVVVCENGIFRLSADGTLDGTFGTNGKVNTGTTISNTCVAVQHDGMVVAGGYIYYPNDYPKGMVRRYTSQGQPDPNFGIGGQMNVSVGDEGTHIFGVALQSDNKIVLCGSYDVYNNGWIAKGLIERLNTTGLFDNSFAGNGKQQVNFTGYDMLNGVAIQADGKVVATGFTLPETGPHHGLWEIALCRLNKDGTLNTAFGDNGKVMTYWPNEYANMVGVAIQSDGKIVVGGDAGGLAAARYQVTKIPTASVNPALQYGAAASLNSGVRVTLYPNPTTSQVQVTGLDAGSPTLLVIHDMSGKTLSSRNIQQSSATLDVQALAPGVYYLECISAGKRQNIPFVKLR